ncbi:MAG: divalent-cation tolerance protein CutA [Rickettsiaceae bacterium]|nr:divalent-cation tolerance protein CutA [Rickettsiaceae bacterium]
MSNPTDCCIILTTTNDPQIAKILAENLITIGLAGCVQIEEIRSYYKWEGEVKNAHEFRLMIKAACVYYDQIVSLIKLKHNYQLPQIVKLDINDGTHEYIEWLLSTK